MGLLVAIGLQNDVADRLKDECLKKLLLVNAPNPHTIRFMPALNITNYEVDQTIEILDNVL